MVPPPGRFQQVLYLHSAFPSIPPQYRFIQPIQQPIPYFSDSLQFHQFYAHMLCDLRENSGQAIHVLSMIAQEFTRWANVVTQCIENHIRRVSHYVSHYLPNPIEPASTRAGTATCMVALHAAGLQRYAPMAGGERVPSSPFLTYLLFRQITG